MSKLFNESMIRYVSDHIDWKQAIHLGVSILVENNIATQQLENAILSVTDKYGAYYVVDHGIALLHAPVGPYCLQQGSSTLILDELIVFNNQQDKKAKIIITLSTIDSISHMDLIKEFGLFFSNDNFKNKALKVKSKQQFLSLVNEYEKIL